MSKSLDDQTPGRRDADRGQSPGGRLSIVFILKSDSLFS
ncbi:hypothetical protein C4J83_2868 [Pseudomonas sp. LBUM920]|nr:hypothetical protein C4J83_2868 [Pseudomonas sp. LBUM920]